MPSPIQEIATNSRMPKLAFFLSALVCFFYRHFAFWPLGSLEARRRLLQGRGFALLPRCQKDAGYLTLGTSSCFFDISNSQAWSHISLHTSLVFMYHVGIRSLQKLATISRTVSFGPSSLRQNLKDGGLELKDFRSKCCTCNCGS